MKTNIFSYALALCALLTSGVVSQAGPKTVVPSELVGKWRWTTISGVNYQDPASGRLEGGGGMSAAFQFFKDGRYTYNFTVKTRTYNYVNESNTVSSGTVVFAKDHFTLHPGRGHYLGWTNGKKVVDRDMTSAERAKNAFYLYKWVEKDGQRTLMIGPAADAFSQFKPDR